MYSILPYNISLTLLTDLYQLTMAYGYWKSGKDEQIATFNLFFRRHPFGGNYTIVSGLAYVLDFLNNFKFRKEDIDYIKRLKLFDRDFLDYLKDLKLSVTVDAIPEGTIVFPREPLIRVTGPILQCQLLETALLNIINFNTLIATKASRICLAADGDPVLEFGLRRAQGIDGGISASRAAYIGGCSATSNVLAGRLYGIPVKGTHAHSWVMSFDSEREAFFEYANAMPKNCVFLVDTYNTITGIMNAVRIASGNGLKLAGIRLDSGNLLELSKAARSLLDDHGYKDTAIIASNDLDEYQIAELKKGGAKIDMWGVGTNLITAKDDPALGGVYKLAAIEYDRLTTNKMKFSDDPAKATIPGIINVSRNIVAGRAAGDTIYLEHGDGTPYSTPNKLWSKPGKYHSLLKPVWKRRIKKQMVEETVEDIRKRVKTQLVLFDYGRNECYPVDLSRSVKDEISYLERTIIK